MSILNACRFRHMQYFQSIELKLVSENWFIVLGLHLCGESWKRAIDNNCWLMGTATNSAGLYECLIRRDKLAASSGFL